MNFKKQYRRKPKVVKLSRKREGACRWFLFCNNDAVTTRPHAFLGDVDICQSCNDKLNRIEATREDQQ